MQIWLLSPGATEVKLPAPPPHPCPTLLTLTAPWLLQAIAKPASLQGQLPQFSNPHTDLPGDCMWISKHTLPQLLILMMAVLAGTLTEGAPSSFHTRRLQCLRRYGACVYVGTKPSPMSPPPSPKPSHISPSPNPAPSQHPPYEALDGGVNAGAPHV